MKKQDILDIVQELPDDVDIDKLIYTLWFRRRLELALAESAEGDLSQEELERLTDAWLR